MSLRALVSVLTLAASPALAYDVITIDGVNDFDPTYAEDGTSGSVWYIENSSSMLYLAVNATDVNANSATRFVVFYLDTDPAGPNGTTTGVTYNTQQPGLPFAADYHLRWRTNNTYTNLLDYNNGTGSWTDDNTGPDNLGIQAFQTGTFVEFAIPLASLGNPSAVRVTAAMLNEQGGVESTFFMMPDTQSPGYDANHTDFLTWDLAAPNSVPALPVWALAALAGALGVSGVRMGKE